MLRPQPVVIEDSSMMRSMIMAAIDRPDHYAELETEPTDNGDGRYRLPNPSATDVVFMDTKTYVVWRTIL